MFRELIFEDLLKISTFLMGDPKRGSFGSSSGNRLWKLVEGYMDAAIQADRATGGEVCWNCEEADNGLLRFEARTPEPPL